MTLTPEAAAERANARWFVGTLAALAVMLVLVLGVAVATDPFGILRDPTGRQLATGPHERQAKYLLNGRYVPSNFDALVIGPSNSVNWPVERLTGARFYNESLEGGNASEERMMVDHALERGHFKVALIGLFPRFVQLHDLADGLDKVDRAEALGSLAALNVQVQMVRHALGKHSEFLPDGSHEMPEEPEKAFRKTGFTVLNPGLDGKAIADLNGMVADLRSRGVKVIYVFYPLYQPSTQAESPTIDAFRATLAAHLTPAPLIDLNSKEYASFRGDPDNFLDGLHLSPRGADLLLPDVDKAMHKLLAGVSF